jgi:hypothetical protein
MSRKAPPPPYKPLILKRKIHQEMIPGGFTLGWWRSSTTTLSEGRVMNTQPKRSLAQSLLLRTAARRADGHIIPPDTLRGSARVRDGVLIDPSPHR